MRILYNSRSPKHKTPFGCIKQNELCTITIHIPVSCQTLEVKLHVEREDGFEKNFLLKKTKTQDLYDFFSADIQLEECGLYFYYFLIDTAGSSFKLMKYGDCDTNIEEGQKWQLTCYPKDFTTPEDFRGKVMYQIFPDRFSASGECELSGKLGPYYIHQSTKDVPAYMPDENGKILNNDFYGGNLKGIEEKLGYLKDIGVSIIYLNPIFMAYSNHRYDTCDYKRIDPMLGTEKDFTSLCRAAHREGMKIILDGVFSHTGSDSIYFDKYGRFGNGAYKNPNSPYADWYSFKNYPNDYESWWGIDTLPCVNELNESYLEYIVTGEDSVIRHWLRVGADGFRLDVADELPDEFIRLLRKTVKEEKKDAVVLGEVWEDASNKIAYGIRRRYFADAELDSVMNYPFRNAIIDVVSGYISTEEFESRIMTIAENYPKEVVCCLMNSLSTHDTPRIITTLTGADMNLSREDKARYVFSDKQRALAAQRLKPAVFLQFFLPGSACIYYGDEIGMEGFGDPFNRAFFNWDNVKNETSDFYLKMTKLKNSLKALQIGDISFLPSDSGVIAAVRRAEGKAVTAVLNLKEEPVKVSAENYLITHNCTRCLNEVTILKGGFAMYE